MVSFIACSFLHSMPLPMDRAMRNAVKPIFECIQNLKSSPTSNFNMFLAAKVFQRMTYGQFEACSFLLLAPSPFLVEPSTKNVAKSKSKTPLCYENALISNFPKFYADELSRKKGYVACFIAFYFFNSNPFPLDWACKMPQN